MTTDVAALLHALEVHQAELQIQNQELIASNEELRRANAELAFAHDRYRALHELAPAPLVTLDAAGVILDVNRAAETLLGTPRRLLIDRRFLQVVAEPMRVAAQALIVELFARGACHGAELEFEGTPPILVCVDGAVLADGGPARAVLALVDLSTRARIDEHRRVLERRAEQALRLESLGVFAGGVAHDFNNLLTVVVAGTDHALRTLDADAPAVEALHDVQTAARHAGELAHQMLAYAGQNKVPVRPIAMSTLLHDLEPRLRAAARSVPLRLELADPVPAINGDEIQLRQVVLNLVVNAAEAMTARPGAIAVTTRIEARPSGQVVVIEVGDDGTGMDAATQARIFEPYFSTRFVGRGLGLAVVHGIVRGHGGEIVVDSQLDRGTTVRIYLPALPPAAPVVLGPGLASGSGPDPRTVLVVDDDPQVQKVIARMVRSLGYAVVGAGGGREAIEVFSAEHARIDVVFMDLCMPDLPGIDAARQIRALSPTVPIVVVTGYGEIPSEAGNLFAGMLVKPFVLDDVRALLATIESRAVSAQGA